MRTLILVLALPFAVYAQEGWHSIFDGKTLDGWQANNNPESWSVRDGAITGDGVASHLFYMREKCINCEFKAEVRINHGGNSGMYVRAAFAPGFPKGYEAQVDNTHSDPVRTGSLYNFVKVFEQLIPDNTWWTQDVLINGNHIVIKVNDRTTVDYIEKKNTFTAGYVALQQHNKGGVVEFRKLMLRALPPPKSPLAGTWRLDRAKSTFSRGEVPTSLEIRILEENGGLRYQSNSVTTDGQHHAANYWAMLDGEDYPESGSPSYDHVALKPIDDHTFSVESRSGADIVVRARYTVSADGKTLTRDGTAKSPGGENHFKEVLEKVE